VRSSRSGNLDRNDPETHLPQNAPIFNIELKRKKKNCTPLQQRPVRMRANESEDRASGLKRVKIFEKKIVELPQKVSRNFSSERSKILSNLEKQMNRLEKMQLIREQLVNFGLKESLNAHDFTNQENVAGKFTDTKKVNKLSKFFLNALYLGKKYQTDRHILETMQRFNSQQTNEGLNSFHKQPESKDQSNPYNDHLSRQTKLKPAGTSSPKLLKHIRKVQEFGSLSERFEGPEELRRAQSQNLGPGSYQNEVESIRKHKHSYSVSRLSSESIDRLSFLKND
jgi:hypothetical protein